MLCLRRICIIQQYQYQSAHLGSAASVAPPTFGASAATALERAPTASASDPAVPLGVAVLGRRPKNANVLQGRVCRPLNTRRSQLRRSRVLLAAAFCVAPHPAAGEASPHLILARAMRFTATSKSAIRIAGRSGGLRHNRALPNAGQRLRGHMFCKT